MPVEPERLDQDVAEGDDAAHVEVAVDDLRDLLDVVNPVGDQVRDVGVGHHRHQLLHDDRRMSSNSVTTSC
jgi:hypothetical protein